MTSVVESTPPEDLPEAATPNDTKSPLSISEVGVKKLTVNTMSVSNPINPSPLLANLVKGRAKIPFKRRSPTSKRRHSQNNANVDAHSRPSNNNTKVKDDNGDNGDFERNEGKWGPRCFFVAAASIAAAVAYFANRLLST